MNLRILNDSGVAAFAEYLEAARAANVTPEPPFALLTDPARSLPVAPTVELEKIGFATKREAAIYLREQLKPLGQRMLYGNTELWAWLSLFYFDAVCPLVNSRRQVLRPYYYIPLFDYKRIYRHLLRTPYMLIEEIPQHNRIWLERPLNVHGEAVEQLRSRLFILRIPGAAEAAEILYYDANAPSRAKEGAFPKKPKPGDLRNRFGVKLGQLSRTYDLYMLDAHQIIQLLGPEFKPWYGESDTAQRASVTASS